MSYLFVFTFTFTLHYITNALRLRFMRQRACLYGHNQPRWIYWYSLLTSSIAYCWFTQWLTIQYKLLLFSFSSDRPMWVSFNYLQIFSPFETISWNTDYVAILFTISNNSSIVSSEDMHWNIIHPVPHSNFLFSTALSPTHFPPQPSLMNSEPQ